MIDVWERKKAMQRRVNGSSNTVLAECAERIHIHHFIFELSAAISMFQPLQLFKYNVANPLSLMLPRSPPLPLIHRTFFLFAAEGSICWIFELVFPPPKFVMRRSEPNKFER